jgi:beta-lactamase class D
MILEKTEHYTLRAKTGWAARVEPNIGWFVGYLETNENVYFFANNIDIVEEEDNMARKRITVQVLEDLNLLK